MMKFRRNLIHFIVRKPKQSFYHTHRILHQERKEIPILHPPVCTQKGPFKVLLEKGKRYSWCTCGRTTKGPFCDNAHRGVDGIHSGYFSLKFTPDETKEYLLCGCKQTKTPPFCDDSHLELPDPVRPVKLSDSILISPPLDATGMYHAKNEGARHIIQLCGQEEEGFKICDPQIVKSFGMSFHHFPTKREDINEEFLKKFVEMANNLDGRIVVACATATRARALGLYLAKARNEIQDEDLKKEVEIISAEPLRDLMKKILNL